MFVGLLQWWAYL